MQVLSLLMDHWVLYVLSGALWLVSSMLLFDKRGWLSMLESISRQFFLVVFLPHFLVICALVSAHGAVMHYLKKRKAVVHRVHREAFADHTGGYRDVALRVRVAEPQTEVESTPRPSERTPLDGRLAN